MRQSVEEMIKKVKLLILMISVIINTYFIYILLKEMESNGYICNQCKTIFNSLDVSRLLNVRTGSFDCDICPDSELQAYDPMNISTSEVNVSTGAAKGIGRAGPHELHSRLMEQTSLIIELLKKADDITIPTFNPALWLELHGSKFSLLNTNENDEDGPPLAIAGSNSGTLNLEQSVSVELVEEGAPNPASSSVSNPLPEWHMYSTVTGEAIRSSNTVVDKNQTDVLKRKLETSIDIEADEVENHNELFNYYTQITAEEEQNNLSPSSKHSKLDLENQVESKLNKFEVSIGGKLVPIDQITEEDKDRMTEEEYTKYYEVFMSQLQ